MVDKAFPVDFLAERGQDGLRGRWAATGRGSGQQPTRHRLAGRGRCARRCATRSARCSARSPPPTADGGVGAQSVAWLNCEAHRTHTYNGSQLSFCPGAADANRRFPAAARACRRRPPGQHDLSRKQESQHNTMPVLVVPNLPADPQRDPLLRRVQVWRPFQKRQPGDHPFFGRRAHLESAGDCRMAHF